VQHGARRKQEYALRKNEERNREASFGKGLFITGLKMFQRNCFLHS
jgi:hypothetical protein